MGRAIGAILIGLGATALGAGVLVGARVASVELRDPPKHLETMRCEEHPPHHVTIRHDLLDDTWTFDCFPAGDAMQKEQTD